MPCERCCGPPCELLDWRIWILILLLVCAQPRRKGVVDPGHQSDKNRGDDTCCLPVRHYDSHTKLPPVRDGRLIFCLKDQSVQLHATADHRESHTPEASRAIRWVTSRVRLLRSESEQGSAMLPSITYCLDCPPMLKIIVFRCSASADGKSPAQIQTPLIGLSARAL